MPGLKKIPIPQLLRTTWYTRILLVLMKMLSFWGILDNQENWIHLVKCQYIIQREIFLNYCDFNYQKTFLDTVISIIEDLLYYNICINYILLHMLFVNLIVKSRWTGKEKDSYYFIGWVSFHYIGLLVYSQ